MYTTICSNCKFINNNTNTNNNNDNNNNFNYSNTIIAIRKIKNKP